MIVIYYIMQNSFEWQNWMIVNLLVGTVQENIAHFYNIYLKVLLDPLFLTLAFFRMKPVHIFKLVG